jgi:hypothetical protein
VKNSTDLLVIDVGASLIRIIDVDEKNQILTTNLWLEMRWTDSKVGGSFVNLFSCSYYFLSLLLNIFPIKNKQKL